MNCAPHANDQAMKYGVIFGLVLVVFWLWRSNRQAIVSNKDDGSQRKPDTAIKTTEIVACALCNVHLPRADAFAGKRGLYCSTEHQQQADH